MPTRTAAEIKRQVEGLQKQRKGLPNFDFFGGNNWEAIDAKIKILKGESHANDYSNKPDRVYSEALDAGEWMDGERTKDLFDEE